MSVNIGLMVFTDLDGTLIDHDTYSWAAARDALERLRHVQAGVVLASSKTAAEIAPLRAELNLQKWPAIVENGAGLLGPHETTVGAASSYAQLRLILDGLPKALRDGFTGFGDMSAQDVADQTGLSMAAAELAKQRAFSEPGVWTGTAPQKTEFLAVLAGQGVTAQQGGRFLTLSFGGNKSGQMRDILSTYQPQHTVALGDAPNDIEMLESADFGIIVANPNRAPMPTLEGETQGRILRTKASGPEGWNAAVLDLLKRLELLED